MKSIKYIISCCAALSLLSIVAILTTSCATVSTVEPVKNLVETPLGPIEFENSYPAPEAVNKLFDALDFQRATQAYLWAIPAVSFTSFRKGWERDFGVYYNDFVIFDNFVDPQTLGYTANATTIYGVSFIDLRRDGLVVVEIPAGAALGIIDDFWQRAVTDVGLAGPDRGQGGKFLLLPPSYEGEVPSEGYHVVRATMNDLNFIIRGLVQNGDVAGAVKTIRKTRVYPFSKRSNPPASSFTSGSGKHADTLIPSDIEFWNRLSEFINNNPVEERDRFFLAMLKPLGIEKGKPFRPNDRQKKMLLQGVQAGEAIARSMLFEGHLRFETASKWKGTKWTWAVILEPDQETEHYSQIDERLHWFFGATYMTPAMALKKAGPGSQYIQTFKDADDKWLDGSHAYRLRIPPNAPAKDFWSVTVYDPATRSMLQNPANDVSLSSYDKLRTNQDGSVDIYFSPEAPKGYSSNWVQTVPGRGFFVWFRAYGPTEPFFDNSWSLKDIEKL